MDNLERFLIMLLGGLALGFLSYALFSEVLRQSKMISSYFPLVGSMSIAFNSPKSDADGH